MSKPAPPKQNFMQTLLLAAAVFMLFQVITNSQKPSAPDPRTATQVYADLLKLNKEVKEASAAQLNTVYEHKIRDEGASAKASQAQMDAQVLRGSLVVSDTFYKSALILSDKGDNPKALQKLNAAYMNLHNRAGQWRDKPEWNQPIDLIPDPAFPSAVSGNSLYGKVIDEISARNKTDLILGIIPGYAIIDTLVRLTGAIPSFSYAFAALILAIIVRAIVWPLAQRQLMWSRQMSQLGPLVAELKQKYEGTELSQKQMELYKEYGINPAAGCLPAMLQMPLFLIIYQCMLHYKFEFQKGTFLWISPAVAKSTGFTAPNLGERDYILLVLYASSMVVSTLLSPITDPSNARQQRLMGIGMSVIFTATMFTPLFIVPSAFVLYWTFTNIFSTIQSLRAYRMPLQPLQKVNGPHGSVLPKNGITNGAMNGTMFKNTGAPKVQKPKPKKRK